MTLFGKTIVGIILIIIGGVGYYFYSTPKVEPVTTTSNEEVVPVQTGKKMAFSQLVAQNGTYKCTVNQYVGDIESKGTVYMNKGLLRAEFATAVANQKIDTTMILRDGYTYTWTSLTPTLGFKSKTITETNTSTTTTTSGTYSWNADQIGDYNCEDWTLDEAKFVVPSTVTFTTVN